MFDQDPKHDCDQCYPLKSSPRHCGLLRADVPQKFNPARKPNRDGQAATLFLIAPMIAVSMAPPAPPAIICEIIPPTLRCPVSAATTTDGSAKVTIWPSSPPPTKPEMMLPIVPRSKLGDALPAPSPPSAPVMRFIRICTMLISLRDPRGLYLASTGAAHKAPRLVYSNLSGHLWR